VLETLPDVELRSGLAEVVKHSVIGDPGLFEQLMAGVPGPDSWERLVSRAMAVKLRIIGEDPYEGGRRAALNLGHTIGHAVEHVSGYQVRHGEAVAIGLVAEARLAEHTGLAESGLAARLAGCLEGLGLPTEIPADLDRQDLRTAMQYDKKKAAGEIRFALPAAIGDVRTGIVIEDLRMVL
jgi:3-dehydroquinate synthetase